MDRLKLLDAGLKAFDASLPEVVSPLCLATRYRGSSCRLCLDVCPAAAITTTKWLAVEPQRCTSCGACAAVCKTGALSYVARHDVLRKRLRGLAAEGARTVVLGCRQAAADAPAADAQKRIVVPCLGGLAVADLIAAGAFGLGTIELLRGDCATCADAVAGAAVEPTQAAAAEVFLALDAPVACMCRSVPGGESQVAAEAPAMSRAGLFSYVAQGLRRTAVEGSAPDKRGVAELHRQAPPPVTRGWLRRDLARLANATPALPARSAHEERSGAESLPARLPLGAVAVSAACDGCGLCVRYCPHGSLALQEDRLVVDCETCSGCGLCAEVCPPAALAVRPAPLPRRPAAGDFAPFRGVLL